MNSPVDPAILTNPATQQAPATPELDWGNRFAALSPGFFTQLPPSPLPEPYLIAISPAAASEIKLTAAQLAQPAMIDWLSGCAEAVPGQTLASVYSGHQFGVWAGQLGDGRAMLLGDLPGRDGQRLELQLKGAGKTPYSRMGDGRAVLRSSIREFLCSEAMFHLGIPTTRALSVMGSDQPIFRESVETAAVVARIAPSFIRFGHFQHFYYNKQHDRLRQLADFVIGHHYPELQSYQAGPARYVQFLREVVRRTARLIAQWQTVGFCHGVMNTDNMSILGLTIDYGPFGFLDAFQANHICNHTDQQGRYSYANQPAVGDWNCHCLAQSLMPLIEDVELAKAALADYAPTFSQTFNARMAAKLGLSELRDSDHALLDGLFNLLDSNRVDMTLFFRRLADVRADDRTELPIGAAGSSVDPFVPGTANGALRDLFVDRPAFDLWLSGYQQRVGQQAQSDDARKAAMNRVNPIYVLRNHLAEQAIVAARGSDENERIQAKIPASVTENQRRGSQDFSQIARLLEALSRPFEERAGFEDLSALPPDWAQDLEVSCSS